MDTVRGAWIAAVLLIAGAIGTAHADTSSGSGSSGVTLEWTAPGDDGYQGEALGYDLRYSLSPITNANFDFASRATTVPRPAGAGIRQSTRVVGLEPNRTYYFALKSVDDAGNWSMLSNVAFKTAPDPTKSPSLFAVALSPPYPSPTRDHFTFQFTLPRDMLVHVNLIDVGGRLVKTLAEGHYPAGTTVRQWDLIDEKGARLGIGQYWLLGVLGDERFEHRVTVIP
jgi:hypothetical protein